MRVELRSMVGLLVLGSLPCLVGCGSSDAHAAGANRRTWVIPHILEKDGRVNADSETFDTTIFATYTGGRAGVNDGGGATVELYLYDEAGRPLSGPGGDVCNPCTLDVSSSLPKGSFSLQDEIEDVGGFVGRSVVLGFGVIVVSGDTDGVSLQGFVVNSHTSAFDLSVFGFEPQPLAASAN